MSYQRSRSVLTQRSDGASSQDDQDSVFDINDDTDVGTEPSDISDAERDSDGDDDDNLDPHCGNAHPPEYFLGMQENFNEEGVDATGYAPRTTEQLDGIEWRWNTYCGFTKQNPKDLMHNLSLATANAFFNWILTQKTGQNGRRLKGIKSLHSLNLYWKEFRLVHERVTKRKIDPILNRKMKPILKSLKEKYGLTGERRENRPMSMDDLKRHADTTISTSEVRFRLGEHRIDALLFNLLIAPSGSRPEALLFLRFGDILISLARDPEGGPHLVIIRFSLHFTKTYLGAKETTTSTLPEYLFDPSLLLNCHVLILGKLFRHQAFLAPSLISPEPLDKLDIHPDEYELPLPLKDSLDDIFVFRDTIKTLNGYVISANKRITYAIVARWMKRTGEEAGFAMAVILYSLRYNFANEMDQCVDVSDGLRNLMLQHKDSSPFRHNYLQRVIAVDTTAIVRHKRQQKSLMRQACSIGFSVSKRRPTRLTPEQAASVDKNPLIQDLLRRRQTLRNAGRMSQKIAQKLERVNNRLISERARLRRELKHQVRKDWSPAQAVTDIERQLAGKTFEELPQPLSDDSNILPAQKRLHEALTAPVATTVEDERRRRNNAILAIMAYCHIQEPPLPRNTQKRHAATSEHNIRQKKNLTVDQAPKTDNKLEDAITSVFVANESERPRRCFLCVGKATTLTASDPEIQRLTKPFYSSGDLSKHFKRRHLSNIRCGEELYCHLCKLSFDDKMHLQNHAETIHGTVSRGG